MKTSNKNCPIYRHLVVIWLSYISSGNHFYADGAINNNEYCSITKQHTMCSPEGYGPQCGSPQGLAQGISQNDIKEILQVHNMWRARISNGLVTRGKYGGPQPPAADMEQMEWDDELARVAQRHADQCIFAHDCSKCRKVKRFNVGQNLHIYKQSIRSAATNWTRGINDWYNEVDLFDKKWVKPFKFSLPIGHYSAMLWSNTNKVGCGLTEYRDGKWFAKLYTCDYAPAGNFINGQMYHIGKPCSRCPRNMECSRQYPGLCVPANTIVRNEIQNKKVKNTTSFKTTKTTRRTTKRTTTTTRRPTSTTTARVTPTTASVKLAVRQQSFNKRKNTPTIQRKIKTTRRPRRTTRRPRTTKRPILSVRTTTEINEVPRKQNTLTSPHRFFQASNITVKSLYKCDFSTPDSCGVKTAGKKWSFIKGYYAVGLNSGEKTELYFSNMVPPPDPKDGGIACLTFRYKKYFPGGGKAALQVLAWPVNGRPGKVDIQKSSPRSTTWIKAQITFRKIDDAFIILFRTTAPNFKKLDLSLDDVSVTEGKCVV